MKKSALSVIFQIAGIFLITFGVIFAFRILWLMAITFDGYLCPACNPPAWEQMMTFRDMENLWLFFTLRLFVAGIVLIAGIVGIVFGCRVKRKVSPIDE